MSRLGGAEWMAAYRRRKQADGFAGMTHGSVGTYNVGCRCEPCLNAHGARLREYRARKKADGFAGLTHGRGGTYALGCRCQPCRTADTERARRARAKRRTS